MQQTAEALEAASPPVFTVDGARATIRLNRPRHVNRRTHLRAPVSETIK